MLARLLGSQFPNQRGPREKSTGQLKTSTDSESRKTSAQKLRELEAVQHQSSGPPKDRKKGAKDDFDSAWDEALTK